MKLRAVAIHSPPPIVVTGPSGWIGSALIARILASGEGGASRLRLFGSVAGEIIATGGMRLPVRPLSDIDGAATEGAIVVHLAYLTKDKVDLVGPSRFFETNERIDAAVLAALEAGRPRGVFIASSGAAALAASGEDRHLYGVCKLRQEDRFLAYAAAHGVPVLAGRIFNLAGPHINKLDSYALSSFLVQGMRDGVIRVGAAMPVFRSFLHVDDLCAIVLAALEMGYGAPTPVDLCGAEVLEMADIARASARACGLDETRVERPALIFDRIGSYLGRATDTQVLAMRLGHTLRPFAVQVADTAADLRDRLQLEQGGDKRP